MSIQPFFDHLKLEQSPCVFQLLDLTFLDWNRSVSSAATCIVARHLVAAFGEYWMQKSWRLALPSLSASPFKNTVIVEEL